MILTSQSDKQKKRWKTVGAIIEGEPIMVSGVNPWNHKWQEAGGQRVRLPHPSYPDQMHEMNVFEIETGGRVVTFAAGELSASVWGFYVPA